MTTKENQMTKQVELSRLVEPKFLTLTGIPANQVAFKVVRNDSNGDSTMSHPAPAEGKRQRRTRSTTRSSLLYIIFPEGTTAEAIGEAAEEYGLEGYEVSQQSDGSMCLKRSDVVDLKDAMTINIGEGKIAGIVRNTVPSASVQDPMPYISVVAIEFNKDSFPTKDSAMDYLQRYDVDFLEKGIENTDTAIRILRSELPADQETRRVEVEKGVIAVVTRAATQDVGTLPGTSSLFTEVVSEAAYGNWGWGQLDFAAYMADVEFCESGREASRMFESVVERILFYNDLPIAVRKELMNRAAAQFAGYLSSLMDALPKQVVLINRSSLEKNKELSMTKEVKDSGTGNPTATLRTEAPAAATPPAATAPAVDAPITRAELAAAVTEAVTAALAAQTTQRSETPPADAPTAAPAVAPAEGASLLASVEEVVTRSVTGLADAVKTMGDRLTQMESSTVVRSDSADSGTGESKSPFVGMFGKTFG